MRIRGESETLKKDRQRRRGSNKNNNTEISDSKFPYLASPYVVKTLDAD